MCIEAALKNRLKSRKRWSTCGFPQRQIRNNIVTLSEELAVRIRLTAASDADAVSDGVAELE
jgi:hypothetical protein